MRENRALKLLKDNLDKGQEFIYDNLCLLVLAGSRLYGTNVSESDYDYVGVCLPTINHVFGLSKFEQHRRTFEAHPDFNDKKVEFVIHDFRKFIKLAMNYNPNINEILYAPTKNIIFCNEIGRSLINFRRNFVSLKCYHSFSGFAHSQKSKLLGKLRNKTGRTELVEKYGFDTKFLMHLFRLYFELIEVLKEGTLNFPLSQRKKLLDIRSGLCYNKDELEIALNDAVKLEDLVNELYTKSELPHKPNYHLIEDFQMEILSHQFAGVSDEPK